jgi:hypothetical protein
MLVVSPFRSRNLDVWDRDPDARFMISTDRVADPVLAIRNHDIGARDLGDRVPGLDDRARDRERDVPRPLRT